MTDPTKFDFSDLVKKPPDEMTFDVHTPQGIQKETIKRGGNIADPVSIDQPLASARPSKFDFSDITKPAQEKDEAPSDNGPGMGWKDSILNFFRPLSLEERNGITNRLGKYFGSAVIGGSNTVLGVTSGAGSVLLHPLGSIYGSAQLAADALNQIFPDSTLNPKQKAAKQASLDRLKAQWEEIKNNPDYALGNIVGGIEGGKALLGGVEKIPEFKGKMTQALIKSREKYAPRVVEVAGKKIPVTVGEAAPESKPGRVQTQLKRSGTGAAKFEKLEATQQQTIKDAIRETGRGDFIGPQQAEPGAVIDDAATSSFGQADPLYQKLDSTIKEVPANFESVSRVVQSALGRAKNLGVDVDEGGDISKIHPEKDGTIQWGGSRISRASQPERWQKLVDDGIIDESGQSTPFRAYRQVRSQLLKMQRSATDAQTRFVIGNEIKNMDASIKAALKGTGLERDWTEANRLWREGKARIEVAKAIKAATKGTPEAAQAEGLSKVPTKLQGANLVKRLNKLIENGTLEDAYSPEQISNLRQSADILDRIQRTPVGRGAGESLSFARGLTHAVRGFKGPAVGAVAGAGLGLVTGGNILHGAEVGAGLGFILQSIGERSLVDVMTRPEGVRALKAVQAAKTPEDLERAITTLQTIGQSYTGPKTRELQKTRADQLQSASQ